MLRLLMVGSSASDGCAGGWLLLGGFCVGGGGVGKSAFAGGGGGGSGGSTRGGGRGSLSGGWGRLAIGRAPGMKEKSSASDDEIQGTCSLREARVTPTRVRLRVSSAIKSGTRISLSNSCTNRLWSPPLSDITELNAAEYMTSVPFGAMTGARPAEKLRKRRSYGLRRDASTSAILTPAPRLLISPSTPSRLTPSRRTSASVHIWASTGIMKLWRLDWTP